MEEDKNQLMKGSNFSFPSEETNITEKQIKDIAAKLGGNDDTRIAGIKEDRFSEVSSDTIPVATIRKDLGKQNRPSAGNDNSSDILAQEKKKRKKRLVRKILISIGAGILGLVIGVIGFLMWYKNYLLSKITYVEPTGVVTIVDESGNTVRLDELRTEQTIYEYIEQDDIHNFLLIGIDSRSSYYNESGTGGLADVNMIMSVNNTEGTIKLVSIARDSYAYVPGYSNPMKINAAMSLGGPDVLVATVEDTLRLNIDGYAYVNFYNMANVIDAVGGVYCYVSDAEAYGEGGLNHNLRELQYDSLQINQTGNIWLNGKQAVAYARIRKIDSDYKRSERQVEVLRSLLSQFLGLSVTGKAAALDDILSVIATNISPDDIESYALDFLPSITNVSIQYMQLPIDGCYNSGMYGSEWSIRPNWNAMIPFVHEFFYGEQVDFDPVRDIPSAPSLENCPTLDDIDIEDLMK